MLTFVRIDSRKNNPGISPMPQNMLMLILLYCNEDLLGFMVKHWSGTC